MKQINRAFDFTNDCAYGLKYVNEQSIWRRYFMYKYDLGAEDPDSKSYTLQEIYRLLWPGIENTEFMLRSDYAFDSYLGRPHENHNVRKIRAIYGETMNSVTTTLNRMGFYNDFNSLKKQMLFYLCNDSDDEGFYRELTRAMWHNGEDFKPNEPADPKVVSQINGFLKAWHVLGNFLPVPGGFNTGRYRSTFDYWDLTLKAIYDWYHGNEQAIESLIFTTGGNKIVWRETVNNIEAWLSSFSDRKSDKPSWQEFVRENYMGAFVEKRKDGSYGPPKELWPGHFTSQALPENGSQISDFLISATAAIWERNDEMYDRLSVVLRKDIDR